MVSLVCLLLIPNILSWCSGNTGQNPHNGRGRSGERSDLQIHAGLARTCQELGDKISISSLRHPAPSPLTHQTLPSDRSQAGCRLCPPPRLPWSSRENSSLYSPSPEISNVQRRRGKEKLSTGPKSWRERVDSAREGREKRILKLETSALGTDLGHKEFKRSR